MEQSIGVSFIVLFYIEVIVIVVLMIRFKYKFHNKPITYDLVEQMHKRLQTIATIAKYGAIIGVAGAIFAYAMMIYYRYIYTEKVHPVISSPLLTNAQFHIFFYGQFMLAQLYYWINKNLNINTAEQTIQRINKQILPAVLVLFSPVFIIIIVRVIHLYVSVTTKKKKGN